MEIEIFDQNEWNIILMSILIEFQLKMYNR